MKAFALAAVLASCAACTAQEAATSNASAVGSITFTDAASARTLVTCTLIPEVTCNGDGTTQKDIDAALASKYYRENGTASATLRLAWKLAQPPTPVMCNVPITSQQPVCPAGWDYYVENTFACTANCQMDEHSNGCKNTCSNPRYTCRRVSHP